MTICPSFWRHKKVLVTGHTGFVGAWLSMVLSELDAKVFGYALEPNTQPNLFNLFALEERIDHNFGDITNYSKLFTFYRHASPDIVIHLAAQPLVRYSYLNPLETYHTNVLGTAHLLECFRKHSSAKVLLNVTTDKCYKNKEWIWGYRESEELGSSDPYSNSKACSELVTASYRESFFKENPSLGVATARAGNIIGGGDWAQDRLIPDCIRALVDQTTLKIRHPNATRPWLFVLDALVGYLSLVEKLWDFPQEFSQAWNFGPLEQNSKSVGYLTQEVAKQTNLSVEFSSENNPHEAHFLKLDSSKARSKLNWNPLLRIDDALEETLSWYKAFIANENMYSYSQKLIERHLQNYATRVTP